MGNLRCFPSVTIRAKHNKKKASQQVLELEFNTRKDEKYEIEAIKDNTVYNKAAKSQSLGLYYLVFFKSYSEDEST